MENKEKINDKRIKYAQDAVFVTGGKWRIPILAAIHQGNTRFKEIQNNVPAISSKILSQELKKLELNKLIIRKTFAASPGAIEYEATRYCETLRGMVEEMVRWGQNHRKELAKGGWNF